MIGRSRVRFLAGVAEELSQKLTSCADCSMTVSSPVFPQLHVKGPGHSAKIVGGKLQLNMPTPLTQPSRSGLTMLPRYGVGNDPGLKTGIGARELIAIKTTTTKRKKNERQKCRRGIIRRTFLQNLRRRGKSHQSPANQNALMNVLQ